MGFDVVRAAFDPCHRLYECGHLGLVLVAEGLVGQESGALTHGLDVGTGVVAVFGRCPSVQDVVHTVQMLYAHVGAQDAESGAQSEEVALKGHELWVVLPVGFAEPAVAVIPSDVQ